MNNEDKAFTKDCESTPGCPWIDHKPIDDGIWDGLDDEEENDDE